MGGGFTLDDGGQSLSMPATPVAVFKFDPTNNGEGRYQLVPNVVVDHIERPIGAKPSTARFHYLLDNSGQNPDWPTQFDDLWPQTIAGGQYALVTDDRIAVIGWTPSGQRRMLFDGFCQIPQVNLDPSRQNVSFVATGSEVRCWDLPIGGRVQRDADTPNGGAEVQTDLPVRFNPSDGKGGVLPNCTPDKYDVNEGDDSRAYPIFMEEHLERLPDPRAYWTIDRACKYILSTQNDQKYVKNPPLFTFSDLLVVKVPSALDGDGVVDPADPSTYDLVPASLRDHDVSNQPWPEAIEYLLARVGFGMYFSPPHDDGTDEATTELYVFRYDQDQTAPKNFLLDQYTSVIDPTVNDVTQIALARDVNQVVNAFSVETKNRLWEVSIILAPGFTPTAGDEVPPTSDQFLYTKIADATATIARKYRWYVADECGDGHWDGSSFVTGTGLDLSPVFPDDDNGKPTYVKRYRPGSHKLITLDQSKHPRRATLHYSQSYTGPYPAVWNGTGVINTDWKLIRRGWRLIPHRLGIEFDVEDLQTLKAGKELIQAITWQANPPTGKRFWLMLTTVIEDDIMLEAVIPRRVASPTQFTRRRRIDARDHYQYQAVMTPSVFNLTKDDIIVRDDTKQAVALGQQYRNAHEMPPLAGTVTIPYITNYYGLSDQVEAIEGRNVSLKTNAGGSKGEADRLPTIVKLSWDFQGDHQSTTLHLSDLRAEVQF